MRQVAQLRMPHAAVLLASESYSVEEIAHQVGYENAFAFSTAFKRIMGASPSSYRTALRNAQ
jgi:AraC-like DNA-binding protein